MSCRPLAPCQTPFLLILPILILSGCSGSRPAPQVDPPPVPGYEALREEFGDRDFTPLKGRRLVIDPGHGGFFRGATGPEGLTEAEVNLGVSLYLRGLLEWAGAEVHLTRTADYDFLTPADSTLSADLAFRVSISDSLQPDVFLSIHHNSTAAKDPAINETQTYYPVGHDGASLDLARSIHRHLALNLDIRPARLLPGNFHVLRNATVPAVLGEPAMISNPVMEGRLSLAASHNLEAQAYFLGLLDHFSAGTPAWAGAARDTLIYPAREPVPALHWTFQPGEGGPAPDPGSFVLLQDGTPVPYALSQDGTTLHWAASGPVPGQTVFEVMGRNLRGRATPLRQTTLLRDTGRTLYLSTMSDGDAPNTLAVTWQTADRHPLPAGTLDLAGSAVTLAHGRDRGSLILPAAELPASATFVPADGAPTWQVVLGPTLALEPGRQWRLLSGDGAAPWQMRTSRPATVTGELYVFDTADALRLERPGYGPLVRTAAGATLDTDDRIWSPQPLLPGLMGRIVVLDPAGGGSDPQGNGPLGGRGADLNLATARQLARLLRGAGAEVHLTRTGDVAPDAPTKVRRATALGADLFLTISRGEPGQALTIGHHHGSVTGSRWAGHQRTAAAALADTARRPRVEPSYAYLLRHTACPALDVALPGPDTAADEIRLADPAWQMAEARALLLAMAATWDTLDQPGPSVDPAALIARLPGAAAPTAVDWARLDGNFDWMPPRPGQLAAGTPGSDSLHSGYGTGWPFPAGPHVLEIHTGASWQLWLLDGEATARTPLILMEAP